MSKRGLTLIALASVGKADEPATPSLREAPPLRRSSKGKPHHRRRLRKMEDSK
ncbi:hypothetical protein ES703_16301 [subsurface metagenome]